MQITFDTENPNDVVRVMTLLKEITRFPNATLTPTTANSKITSPQTIAFLQYLATADDWRSVTQVVEDLGMPSLVIQSLARILGRLAKNNQITLLLSRRTANGREYKMTPAGKEFTTRNTPPST